MDYLLDTNACIALMAAVTNPVQTRFTRAAHRSNRFYTSSVVAFELWYGAFKSVRIAENSLRCEAFFSGPIEVLAFQETDAKLTGQIRAELERAGRPIGAYDLLLAGQAMRHKLTLITANISEFSRVKGLVWEDWSK